ncbi:MAG: bacillithiol biosynthesis cysteine-adding enzyme BshC [Bacteroidetes bacterium]|nr:bacillithiol biosynthesis cysteine-adding enzyme BshC [Bacteroidota bacterium]
MEQPSAAVAVPQTPAHRTLPLADIPGYPPFLSTGSGNDIVLLTNGLASLEHLRSLERFTPEHRAALAEAIALDLERWNAPHAATEAAAALRSPETYAVITGQQAGLAGGPLYTLYKAIGAIRAAEDLARLHPEHRFVPVFWIEADDHDFDEVRMLTLLDRSGAPVTVAYDDGDRRPLHVGERRISTAGLASFLEEVRTALPATEFGDEALAMLQHAYDATDNATLADGFARALYAVLGETPLVLLSSRNAGLKRLAADVFARELSNPTLLFDALMARTSALAAEGLPTPIEPKPGALFITHNGERRALDYDGSGYTIRGAGERMTIARAAELAATQPERFSPKVALRPIVQDAILPTAVYLGGPSEVAYLRQIRDAYGAFGIEAPATGPRPFVLITDPKSRRALDAAKLELTALLEPDFDAAALLVDREMETRLEEAHARAMEKVEEARLELEEIVRAIDPTLEKSLGAAAAGATKSFDDLAKRAGSALRKKQSTEIERLNAARAFLMPRGELQERSLNALTLIARFGVERCRLALNAITMDVGVIQVVDM